LSEPAADDSWTGETGWVHESVLRQFPNLKDLEVYASGPPPMIDAARTAFAANGLSETRLFYDSFEFGADVIEH